MEIQVRYSAVDGFSKARRFKTLAGARRFAVDSVGARPEMGSCYAVSGDGVGKVTVRGCTLAELFAEPAAAAPAGPGYEIKAHIDADGMGGCFEVTYDGRHLETFDTRSEAAQHIAMSKQHDEDMMNEPSWA